MTGRLNPEQQSLDRPITTAGQLLVEGRTPEMFFREMVAACELQNAIEARTFGDVSKDNLQAYLEIFTQKAAFKERVKRLGIIRDAEAASAASAFSSVQAALREAGLPTPLQLNCLEGSPLRVAVFILPNCKEAGMLEDLCLTAATEVEQGLSGAVLPCIDDFFACLEKRGKRPANPAKARFGGYALACDVVDPQLGRAAQQGAITWNAKAFEPLRAFLRLIAGDSDGGTVGG
jgi:hypothetical protein